MADWQSLEEAIALNLIRVRLCAEGTATLTICDGMSEIDLLRRTFLRTLAHEALELTKTYICPELVCWLTYLGYLTKVVHWLGELVVLCKHVRLMNSGRRYLVTRKEYQFVIGGTYTRQDVFRVVGVLDPGGGAWYTGYTSHLGDWFIFCGIETPGRTGHDYHNHFVNDDLVWFGKTSTTIHQPAIRAITSDASRVYIFYRSNNRGPFTFAGRAKAKAVKESTPVEILWSFNLAANSIEFPDELPESGLVFEGAKKTVAVNLYERDAGARAACLRRWGVLCTVCGFDFKAAYGDLGDGYIHVHHLRPLSEIGGAYELDPVLDLRPVCPNCHAMLHRSRPALTIEELQEVFRRKSLVRNS